MNQDELLNESSEESNRGVSRRGFLQGAGVLAAASAAAPMAALAGQNKATSGGAVDAVVIGGGFAGLVAARELAHAGKRVVLLEARNRLGGRTFYTRFGDHHYDMGGTFVHWIQPHVWTEITRYGLELVETPSMGNPDRVMWLSEGQVKEPPIAETWKLLQELNVKFHEPVDKVYSRPYVPFPTPGFEKLDAMSIADRIREMNLTADQRDLLASVMNANVSGQTNEASYVEMLRWWKLAGNDMGRLYDACLNYRFKNGTSSLADAIVKDGGYEVRLSSPVSRVEQDSKGALVTLESGGKIRSKVVVVAVPMNTLNQIEFRPGLLPGKVAAASERHAGAGVKVYIKVKGKLPELQLYAPYPEPFSAIITAKPGVLVAFGPSPKLIDVHSVKAVEKALQKFIPDIKVEETFSYDWTLDPYSLGTWPTLRPRQLTRYLKDLQSPEGRLFFATSDIASGWRGFIDGAIESGLTAGAGAIRVLSHG